jgi:hypothetical protein
MDPDFRRGAALKDAEEGIGAFIEKRKPVERRLKPQT